MTRAPVPSIFSSGGPPATVLVLVYGRHELALHEVPAYGLPGRILKLMARDLVVSVDVALPHLVERN